MHTDKIQSVKTVRLLRVLKDKMETALCIWNNYLTNAKGVCSSIDNILTYMN